MQKHVARVVAVVVVVVAAVNVVVVDIAVAVVSRHRSSLALRKKYVLGKFDLSNILRPFET